MSSEFKHTALPPMTVAQFLEWADAQRDDARYELDRGVVQAMAPGNMRHNRVMGDTYIKLRTQLDARKLDCEAILDGLGVKIDEQAYYIPDLAVNCGSRIAGDARFLPNPIVVIEVLSVSTGRMDKHTKLNGYFCVSSIEHYVVIDLFSKVVFHHQRTEGGRILTTLLREGDLILKPPGLSLAVAELLAE